MQVKITKFTDLIKLIQDFNLNDEQIKLLLSNTVGIYVNRVPPKPELLKQLEEYWKKYKGPGEKPLFLD